jgi:hypothetical protein
LILKPDKTVLFKNSVFIKRYLVSALIISGSNKGISEGDKFCKTPKYDVYELLLAKKDIILNYGFRFEINF